MFNVEDFIKEQMEHVNKKLYMLEVFKEIKDKRHVIVMYYNSLTPENKANFDIFAYEQRKLYYFVLQSIISEIFWEIDKASEPVGPTDYNIKKYPKLHAYIERYIIECMPSTFKVS